jgi:type I restriction enzyme S subunit
VIASAVNASNQTSINQKALADLPLPLPPTKEQEQILACLENARVLQAATRSTLMKDRAQKAGLMHDLLTGERRVTPLLAQATTQ